MRGKEMRQSVQGDNIRSGREGEKDAGVLQNRTINVVTVTVTKNHSVYVVRGDTMAVGFCWLAVTVTAVWTL